MVFCEKSDIKLQVCFDDLITMVHVSFLLVVNSQGARNLKIRSAQLTRQKRFECIDDKNYPSTTFLGTSYGQIVVVIFQEQAFCTTTPFCNCLRKSAT